MNHDDAEDLARLELSKIEQGSDLELVLLPDETQEHPFGWVFFYQSRAYAESGDFKDQLVGNAPFIIDRNTRKITHLGTAESPEFYIHRYSQTGDPFSKNLSYLLLRLRKILQRR